MGQTVQIWLCVSIGCTMGNMFIVSHAIALSLGHNNSKNPTGFKRAKYVFLGFGLAFAIAGGLFFALVADNLLLRFICGGVFSALGAICVGFSCACFAGQPIFPELKNLNPECFARDMYVVVSKVPPPPSGKPPVEAKGETTDEVTSGDGGETPQGTPDQEGVEKTTGERRRLAVLERLLQSTGSA